MKIDQNVLVKAGIESLLRGMEHIHAINGALMSEYRSMLERLEAGELTAFTPEVRRGRPPKTLAEATAQSIEEFESEVRKIRAEKNGSAPVKKRGRPPKAELKSHDVADGVERPTAELMSKAEACEKYGMSKQQFERTAKRVGIHYRVIREHKRFYAVRDIERMQKAFEKQIRNSSIARTWAKLTPEERKAEMERRRAKGLGTPKKAELKAKPIDDRRHAKESPRQVGENITLFGAAQALKVSTSAVAGRLRRMGIKLRMVPHPTRKGNILAVMTADEFSRLKGIAA